MAFKHGWYSSKHGLGQEGRIFARDDLIDYTHEADKP
jgi:hypothetical protein